MGIYDLPYLHARGDGGPRPTTQVVVIHATDNTAGAKAEANYATTRSDMTSAHFYVDGSSAYRALPLGNIAYGCKYHGNRISVQFELCGISNKLSEATWRKAAPIVAEVCKAYNLPIRKLSPSEVRNGVKGICGHADITLAFPEDHGDHTDPGNLFPWSQFITAVAGGVEQDMTPDQAATLDWLAARVFALTQGVVKPWWGPKQFVDSGEEIVLNKNIQALLDRQPNSVTLTDEQVDRIAQAVIARPDIALDEKDFPAIKTALKQGLAELLSS